MIALDSGDKIRGDASTDAVVDYVLSGTDANAIKQLAAGQLSDTTGDLYEADSVDAVTGIILVNTHSSAVTVNLFLLPASNGTDRRIISKDLSLGIGYSLHTDGRRITVMDASGNVLYSITQNLGNLTNVTLTSEADHDMIYYDNATSLWKNATPATILAQLSGQAGAAFDFNSQNVTGVAALAVTSIGAHQLTGALDANANNITNVAYMSGGALDDAFTFDALVNAANAGTGFHFRTKNAGDAQTTRFYITGGVATAVATWANITHTGIVLSGALTLNSQAFDAGSGNAVINTTGLLGGLLIRSTQDGATGATIYGYTTSANPAHGDTVLRIYGGGEDDNSVEVTYGRWDVQIEDDATGAVVGKQEWQNRLAGAWNSAMTLSGAGGLGVDADIGTADDPVALFDDYDDALVLRQSIQKRNHELLVDMGVFSRKDTGSGFMMNIQPMTRLLAGGVYQNRAKIDNLEERLTRAGI